MEMCRRDGVEETASLREDMPAALLSCLVCETLREALWRLHLSDRVDIAEARARHPSTRAFSLSPS